MLPDPLAAGAGLWLPPGLRVSFQRYAAGAAIDPPPPSLGALLPARTAAGEWLLPVAPQEAFWIGCEARMALRLALEVLARDGTRGGLVRDVAGPDRIAGFSGRAFTLAAVERLHFATDSGFAVVRVVDYGEFTGATGRVQPVPLDPGAGYRGWRLP